jgi:2-polyprenyl-6-methoxyphenol hydroxylase-like FAD-dependent oxidoreductase
MSKILVAGAGLAGLSAAMLLAQDGHAVTVVERDAAPAATPDGAWQEWERRGVTQFRQPHFLLAPVRQILDRELPEVSRALDAAGALRLNFIGGVIPESVCGPRRPNDDDFEILTGRRPFVEAAVRAAAEATPGLQIHRGAAVTGLAVGRSVIDGVPHVTGVRLESGETLTGDLLVDATGRRSSLPEWLTAVGARPPTVEAADSGFIYLSRHFRSRDGATPAMIGPAFTHVGTISSLSLPADNATWAVALVIAASDRALLGLRDVQRWESVVRSLPLIAHWLDGDPIDDGVKVMARMEDRVRDFAPEVRPVATGVVALADSWACTNPSQGRGFSFGLMHAVALRDRLRSPGLENPRNFVEAFHSTTTEVVEPWLRSTLAASRHRLAEVEALARGEAYLPADPVFEGDRALGEAALHDPDLLRANLDARLALRRPEDMFADRAFSERVLELGGGWRETPVPGPTREQLVEMATALP